MITTLSELNEYIGRHVYLLMVDGEIYATTLRKEIDEFLRSEDSPMAPWDVDEGGLIHGLILDPKSLPYEVPDDIKEDRAFYVFKSESSTVWDIELETHDTLEEATRFIEYAIEDDSGMIIDEDFAILLADEIEFVLASKESGKLVNLRVSHG
jgi:hypothetical protein